MEDLIVAIREVQEDIKAKVERPIERRQRSFRSHGGNSRRYVGRPIRDESWSRKNDGHSEGQSRKD
jgi:hypothetical protein